jgi:hypothetical protein
MMHPAGDARGGVLECTPHRACSEMAGDLVKYRTTDYREFNPIVHHITTIS